MSAIWFECKVKYRKTNDNGVQKITTESYLVDALSYTEAERRINEEMAKHISEEFKVTNIKSTNYAEVHSAEMLGINQCHGIWFKSKVSLIAYDEESGKERKTNIYLLVTAADAKEAYENTVLTMKNTMGEYAIPTVSETKIIDVFPYVSDEVE